MIRARSPASWMSGGVEHHGHGLDVGVHHCLVLQPDGYPRRLLRRKQVVRRVGLHLHQAVQGVLDLMHLVRVPPGDQPVAFIEVAARERAATAAQFDHRASDRFQIGRFG